MIEFSFHEYVDYLRRFWWKKKEQTDFAGRLTWCTRELHTVTRSMLSLLTKYTHKHFFSLHVFIMAFRSFASRLISKLIEHQFFGAHNGDNETKMEHQFLLLFLFVFSSIGQSFWTFSKSFLIHYFHLLPFCVCSVRRANVFSSKNFLVTFFAPWSGPNMCRTICDTVTDKVTRPTKNFYQRMLKFDGKNGYFVAVFFSSFSLILT